MIAWCLPTIVSNSSIISRVTSSSASPKSMNAPVYAPFSGSITSTGALGSGERAVVSLSRQPATERTSARTSQVLTVILSGVSRRRNAVEEPRRFSRATLPQDYTGWFDYAHHDEQLNPHRHGRSPFQFSPAHQGALDRAQDRFPNHVAQHRP